MSNFSADAKVVVFNDFAIAAEDIRIILQNDKPLQPNTYVLSPNNNEKGED